jgi:hypothetical protein
MVENLTNNDRVIVNVLTLIPNKELHVGLDVFTVLAIINDVKTIPSSTETPECLPDIHEGPPNLAESNAVPICAPHYNMQRSVYRFELMPWIDCNQARSANDSPRTPPSLLTGTGTKLSWPPINGPTSFSRLHCITTWRTVITFVLCTCWHYTWWYWLLQHFRRTGYDRYNIVQDILKFAYLNYVSCQLT